MRVLHADLHVHTCLSPCAEREMSPRAVVTYAREKGLDLIAICDHNSAENVEAAGRAGEQVGLAVVPGMEITSREEVHVLGLFEQDTLLYRMQQVVYDNLPGENDPDTFGEQLVMDDCERVVGRNHRLLIGATQLTLQEVVRAIHEFEGLAIAAHVDRPSFSVLSQLGFIPDGLGLDGVEVCSNETPAACEGMPAIFSSDGHRPEEIGARHTRFQMERPTAGEIRMALKGLGGRGILARQ
ncbi:MAG: PHP domain-containing protein [Planctomycetota bacterium]